MRTELPIIAALTPADAPALPTGATLLDSRIRGGLPHVLNLAPRFRALVSLPTGSARFWLDQPPDIEVLSGAPRLRVQRDGTTIAVVPLVLGPTVEVVDPLGAAPLLIQVLAWSLHVGDLRGAGDFGSFVRLAFAVADRATDRFGPLPPSDFVIRRLPPAEVSESRPGRKILLRYARLKQTRIRRAEELRR